MPILDAPAEYDYEPGYYAFFFSDPDLKLEVMHVAPGGSDEYSRRYIEAGKPMPPLEIAEPLFVREALAKARERDS